MRETMRISAIFLILIVATAGLALAQTTPTPTPAPGKTPSTAQEYFAQGRDAFAKDDLDGAIFNCRMAISMKADFVDAHYMLGKAYLIRAAKANRLAVRDFGLGTPETRYLQQYVKGRADLKKAIRHFNKALELVPDDIDALLNLGIAQDNYGQDEQAIVSYEKVIAMDPVSTHARDAYNNLGLVFVSTESYKKAKKAYESALSIDPNFAPAKINLQRLLILKPKLK